MEEEVKKYAQYVYELLQGDDTNADEMWEHLLADGFIDSSELWLGEQDDE